MIDCTKKRKKLSVALLLLLFSTLTSVKAIPSDDYLINSINLQLPSIQTNLAYSSTLANDYVISIGKEPPAPIQSVNNLVHHKNFLYITAQDWLLKLNSTTFQIIQSVQYGPVYDSVYCRYFPVEECTRDSSGNAIKKTLTHNFNKLLLIYEKQNALLTCWSAHQGICELRDLDNLENRIQQSNIPTVANDAFNSTVGFISSAANSQDLLYVAATFNDQGPYRGEVPALAGRSIGIGSGGMSGYSRFGSSQRRFMDILSSSQGLKSSKASIEFISRFQKSFIVKYVDAFNLGIYNYFLTVQHADTSDTDIKSLLVTKLARLCSNDLSFTKSYTELPLQCTGNGLQKSSDATSYSLVNYNELISARMVNIKTKNWASNNEDTQFLIGLFQATDRITFNASLPDDMSKTPIKQAVCVFSMRQIQEKIKENLNKCYNVYESQNVMRGLSFIKPDQRCSSVTRPRYHTPDNFESSSQSLIGDDFCSTADNNGIYPIGGRIPAPASASIEFDTEILPEFFDSLQVWSETPATSLILMSNRLQKIQMFHMRSPYQIDNPYRTHSLSATLNTAQSSSSSLKSLQLTESTIFATSNSEVYSLKLTACHTKYTCNECIAHTDPHCGWCSGLNKCTTQPECALVANETDSNKAWVSGVHLNSADSFDRINLLNSMCIDVVSIEPVVSTLALSPEWIQVNFRKEIPLVNTSGEYQCVFGVSGNKDLIITTDAFQMSSVKLKCSTPHYSKLQQIFTDTKIARSLIDQNLTIGDDGIFSVANEYYYEAVSDKLVLPLYVQSRNVRYGMVNGGGSNETETIFNLTVVDCSVRQSCLSCLASEGQCSWCGGTNQCRSSNDVSPQSATCIKSSDSQQCPSFDTGTSKLLIPFTLHRHQAPLTLALQNLNAQDPDLDLQCLLTIFNGRFLARNVTLPYEAMNQTHGQCIFERVFDDLDFIIASTGQVQTNLRLYSRSRNVFIDSVLNGRLSLMFYKCETKANDCGQCLSLNKQFSCMWCNHKGPGDGQSSQSKSLSTSDKSTCRFMNANSKQAAAAQCISAVSTFFSSINNKNAKIDFNQCDKPQISQVRPTKLPVAGGTTLTITGVNLGSSILDIDSVSIQCGSDLLKTGDRESIETLSSETACELIPSQYIPSKQIVCRTGSSTSGPQRNCRVSLKLKSRLILDNTNSAFNPEGLSVMNILITNSQTIEYVDPLITEILPGTIIQSANFVWLTVKGLDLDAGLTRDIELIDYTPGGGNRQLQRVIKCEIKNVTASEVKCRLNDKFRTLGKKDLKFTFDNYMSIMHYLSTRVTTDPLVDSIDKAYTIYSGGTGFTLSGSNFNAVQSAYTYIVFRDMWYSAPLPARKRLSNDVIEFDFPPLTEAFFDMVRSTSQQQQQTRLTTRPLTTSSAYSNSIENYQLQIGFLMDGFNVTLKETPIIYMPNFTPQLISIQNIKIAMAQQSQQKFSLIVDLTIDHSVQFSDLIKNDLQIYVACSPCMSIQWLNSTRISCDLPEASVVNLTTSDSSVKCPQKVFNAVLDSMDKHNILSLVNTFIGNYQVASKVRDHSIDQNLKIYLQTYALNNIDDYQGFSRALAANTISTNRDLLDRLLLTGDWKFKINDSEDTTGVTAQNLILIAAVVAALLVMLIIFTLVLVMFIMRMKRKCRLLSGSGVAMLGAGSRKTKSDKKIRLYLEKCQQQIDQIELSVRSRCAQMFQQLHLDYLNELNHDMIYTLGLPVWNYKTYLFKILFQSSTVSKAKGSTIGNLAAGRSAMTCSSMSNSTTNSLLSGSVMTPLQKQHLNSATMSVYATIKSSNMLMNGTPDTSSQVKGQVHFSANVSEAMQLFDQLLFNKSFLLTYIQVCESSASFTPKDRLNLASLLTISLKSNLPYFYSIIKLLLTDLIAHSFTVTKSSKLLSLFTSNSTLVEPLLANWLAMFMHDFHKDTQCGTQLFRLTKAVKFYIDMAPCDQQTHQSPHSLSEQSLLKEPINFSVIYLNVVNQCQSQQISNGQATSIQVCRVLDMDTVSQAKDKILEYLYKANPSIKPNSGLVDLELCLILLNSNNNSMDVNTLNSMSKQQQQHTTTLITLKDYNIQNGSFINVCFKASYAQQEKNSQHVYMSTLSMSNEYQIYAANERIDKKLPSPPMLPPLFQTNRYHIVKPQLGAHQATYDSTSASSASTSESHISSISSSDSNKHQRQKNLDKKKSKQYEKLLSTVSRHHDSAANTGTTTTTSLLLNDTTSNYANTQLSPLHRLLINKGTLQPFIDQFFEALFTNTSNLPPVVQHVFEFFDQEIKKHQRSSLSEADSKKLTRSWKTNAYLIRYWSNLIKNPELVLDCTVSPLTDASLSCISQLFTDACLSQDTSHPEDSGDSINRLLFMREIPKYAQMVDEFFNEMDSYQAISDHELHFYLNEFCKFQSQSQNVQTIGGTIRSNLPSPVSSTSEVNTIQVLMQLYEYYEKFEQPINALLGQQQCSVLLPVHHKLVQIKDLLTNQVNSVATMRFDGGQTNQYNTLNPNPYQQPINCYATSSEINSFQIHNPASNSLGTSINNQNFIFNNLNGGNGN